MKRPHPEIKAIVLLFLFILLAYWKVIFTRSYTYFVGVDSAGQYYPWYQFAGWSWKNGSIPLWDPFVRGGKLYFDEMQQGSFYPFNLILFLLPAQNGGVDLWIMDFMIVFSILGAGLGEYLLLRFLQISRASSIIGSIIFALGGYTTFIIGHQSILKGAVWLPWIVLMLLKGIESTGANRVRFMLGGGFLLGIAILAGHIQPPAHICLILLFLTIGMLCRKQSGRFRIGATGVLIGIIVFSIAVAAVQLIPSLLYSLNSYRWIGGVRMEPGQYIPFELQELWSPAQYLSLLVPSTTSHQFYFGIGTLFLAMFGALVSRHRYRRLFAVGALLCFLYSWGKLSSLYGALYLLIPFIEKVPESSRSIFMLHFFVAGLAAIGADTLLNPLPASSRRKFHIVANTALASACIILIVLLMAAFWQIRQKGVILHDSFFPYGIFAALICLSGGLIFLRKYRMIRLKSLRAALVFIVAFDLTSFVMTHTPLKQAESADRLYAETSTTVFLKGLKGIFRVGDPDGLMPLNFGDAYRIQTTGGYGASLRKGYHDFVNSLPGGETAMRMLNVRYYVRKNGSGIQNRVHCDAQTGISVYEDPQALPRLAFVAANEVSDSSKIGEFLLRKGRIAGESRILSYQPNEIRIACRATTSGYLWMSELAYPGWKATVDGGEAPIFISDKVFRAIEVPYGEHTIRLVFTPVSFYVGAAISLPAFLIGLISVTGCFRTRKRHREDLKYTSQ